MINLQHPKILLYLKPTTMKTQTLFRKQFITLLNLYSCEEWKKEIKNILISYYDKEDNYPITIPQSSINKLITQGTNEQKTSVKALGIVLEEDNSVIVDNEFLTTKLEIRKFDKYANKGIYLNHAYNWELKKDNENALILVPTKKK